MEMQPNNRSSFIPKKSIKRVERVRSGKQVYILSYITYAIFFATLLAVAAVFFYTNVLRGQLENKVAELDAQRVAFSQGDIARVKEAERQIKIADYLFSKHVSTYAIFNEIEELAVDGIIFSSFSYNRIDDQIARLSVSGGTEQFDSVAFQNSLLRNADILQDAQFTGINKTGDAIPNTIEDVSALRTQSTQSEDELFLPVGFSVTQDLQTNLIPFSLTVYEEPVVFTGQSELVFEIATGTDSGESNEVEDGSEIVNDADGSI